MTLEDAKIAEYRDRLEAAEKSLSGLGSDYRFFVAEGNQPLRDVTDERVAELKADIATYTSLIARYETDKAALS